MQQKRAMAACQGTLSGAAALIAAALAITSCDGKINFAPLVIDREFGGIYVLAEATPILEENACQAAGQNSRFQLLEIGANTIDHYFSTVIGTTDCAGDDKIGTRFRYLVEESDSQPQEKGEQRLTTTIFDHFIRVESTSAANTLNLESACGKTDWLKGEYGAYSKNYLACADAPSSQLGGYITKPPANSAYKGSVIELAPFNRGIRMRIKQPNSSTFTTRYFLLRR